MKTKFYSTCRGFTLIELLVVIAIIAILAAILVPVVKQALDRGRFMHCTSNVGQLAKAAYSFTADHEGSMPNANWGKGSSGWLFARGRMDDPKYVEYGELWGYVGVRHVYRCAADPQPSQDDRTIGGRPNNTRMMTSFCMNGSVVGYGRNPATSPGKKLTFLVEQFRANDILFWEPDESREGGWWWDGANFPWEGISPRHFDKASVANFDGSAHGMELTEFYEMARPSARERTPHGRNRLYNNPNSADGS